MKRIIIAGMTAAALLLATAAPVLADKPAPAPPAVTDNVTPGKACAHANLAANRNFGADHATGVAGQGTPPTCGGIHVPPPDFGDTTPTPGPALPTPGLPIYGAIPIIG